MQQDTNLSVERGPELNAVFPLSQEQPVKPGLNDLFRENGYFLHVNANEVQVSRQDPGLNDIFRENGYFGSIDKTTRSTWQMPDYQLQRRMQKAFAVGAFAVLGALSTLTVVSGMGRTNSSAEVKPDRAAVVQPVPELVPELASEATLPLDTTPIPAEVIALPEPALVAPFEVGPGESLGVLSIPALCEDIEVIGYNESEILNEVIGSGNAVVDRLERATSDEDCATVDQREAEIEAATGTDLITRAERNDWSLSNPENPNGNVDFYRPIAGSEQGLNGGFLSVFPGQPGNSLISGHGSTYSAPFADIGLLKPGDEATFSRSDGTTYNYRVIESEILPNDDFRPFLNYSKEGYNSTITIYRCGALDGRTGSAEARFAVRLGLVE